MSALQNWKTMDRAERDDLLRRYIEEGLSGTQIAKKFTDCLRGSVAGRAHRLGLKLNGTSGKTPKAEPKPPKPRKSRKTVGSWGGAVGKLKAKARRVAEKPTKKASPSLDAVNFAVRSESLAKAKGLPINHFLVFDPLPGSEPVHFIQNSGCRWPVDGQQGHGLLVCGLSKDGHHSYCDAHRRIAYTTPIERAA